MKTCVTCKEDRSEADFWGAQKRRDGTRRLQSECKSCMRVRTRKWQDAHPEKRAERIPLVAVARAKRPERFMLTCAKARAKKSGLDFSLDIEDVVIPSHCPVLGIALSSGLGKGKFGGQPNSPALDRIDNTKGYIKGNVVVVSWRANRIKSDATVEELEALASFYRRVSDIPSQE